MGHQMKMEKTKNMVTAINLDKVKSGKDPCGVVQTGEGSNANFCGGFMCLIHKKCSGIKGLLRPDPKFRCARSLPVSTADWWKNSEGGSGFICNWEATSFFYVFWNFFKDFGEKYTKLGN